MLRKGQHMHNAAARLFYDVSVEEKNLDTSVAYGSIKNVHLLSHVAPRYCLLP